MASQKKYYYQFTDLRERVHIVELWQNTEDVLVAEEVKGHMNPFSVEMPEIDHKFQVVRGSGCQINLLSQTDMKFFDGLNHVDPQEFMIFHYIDAALNYIGYLNAEMLTEPYDIDFNYQVSVTGNDGFALMDRLSLIDSLGVNYFGIATKWEWIRIAFGRVALPFTEYRVAISTTFIGQSSAIDKTILHESYITAANFYDEDDKPMTLRETLESILAPYGAYIRTESGIIYISDVHTLASNSSVTYKRFDYTTNEYLGAIAVVNQKSISSIGYKGTGQSIERSGGTNRQVVTYSPYPFKLIIDKSFLGTDEFAIVPSSWSTKNGYNYKYLQGHRIWAVNPALIFEANPPTFEASYYLNEEETNIYFRWTNLGNEGVELPGTMVMSLTDPKYINITGSTVNPLSTDPTRPIRRRTKYYDGTAINISGEVLTKAKTNPYDDTELSSPNYENQICYVVKIGSKYYDKANKTWGLTLVKNYISIIDESGSISDKFVSFSENIILGSLSASIVLEGLLDIQIYDNIKGRRINGYPLIYNLASVDEVWIKNMSVKLSNFDGTEIEDNDIEYIGNLDPLYQNEGEKIELTCGTDAQFADRGKILYFTLAGFHDITQWTRNGQTFKIEELLLGSLSSNYRAGFITLSNMKLKNSFSLQNILTDTFIGSKKLMLKSANINYQDDVVECSLVEITPDELTIVK